MAICDTLTSHVDLSILSYTYISILVLINTFYETAMVQTTYISPNYDTITKNVVLKELLNVLTSTGSMSLMLS